MHASGRGIEAPDDGDAGAVGDDAWISSALICSVDVDRDTPVDAIVRRVHGLHSIDSTLETAPDDSDGGAVGCEVGFPAGAVLSPRRKGDGSAPRAAVGGGRGLDANGLAVGSGPDGGGGRAARDDLRVASVLSLYREGDRGAPGAAARGRCRLNTLMGSVEALPDRCDGRTVGDDAGRPGVVTLGRESDRGGPRGAAVCRRCALDAGIEPIGAAPDGRDGRAVGGHVDVAPDVGDGDRGIPLLQGCGGRSGGKQRHRQDESQRGRRDTGGAHNETLSPVKRSANRTTGTATMVQRSGRPGRH